MTYLEYIFLCLAVPLLIASVLLSGKTRLFLRFFLVGMVVCLLSSYCNSFIAAVSGMPLADAMAKYTPMLEESLKALPLVYYLLVCSPSAKRCLHAALALGLGVATLENCCYLLGAEAQGLSFVLMRGLATGVLHALCAALFGAALFLLQQGDPLRWLGVFAAFCQCVAYHALYNLLVTASGAWQMVGYCLPFATAVVVIALWLLQHRAARSPRNQA